MRSPRLGPGVSSAGLSLVVLGVILGLWSAAGTPDDITGTGAATAAADEGCGTEEIAELPQTPEDDSSGFPTVAAAIEARLVDARGNVGRLRDNLGADAARTVKAEATSTGLEQALGVAQRTSDPTDPGASGGARQMIPGRTVEFSSSIRLVQVGEQWHLERLAITIYGAAICRELDRG